MRQRLCTAVAAAWALLPCAAPAQLMELRETQRRDDGSGIVRGVESLNESATVLQIDVVEVQLARPDLTLALAVPLAGPWESAPLGRLAESVAGLAALGLELTAEDGHERGLRGMVAAEGRLYAWPPRGEQLVYTSEGSIELTELAPGSATLLFADGTSFPLLGINSDPPTRSGELVLATGAMNPRQLPMAAWPDDLVAARLTPREVGADPHALLLEDPWRNRSWSTHPPTSRILAGSGEGEALLLFVAPAPAPLLERLESGMEAQITVAVATRAAQARLVVPAPPVVARGGVVDVPDVDMHRLRNGLALDPVRRRAIFFSTGTRTGRQRTVPLAPLVELLAGLGYADVLELPEVHPLLMVSPDKVASPNSAAAIPVRHALAAVRGNTTLTLPGRMGAMVRLAPNAIRGTMTEFPRNLPTALTDGRVSFQPSLDHFWAAPSTVESPAVVTFLFSQPRIIGAVDVLHAENAGFSPQMNVAAYRLRGREAGNTAWVELARVDHAEPALRDRLILDPPARVREMELTIERPSFLPLGNTARLVEVIFWGME